MRFEYVLPSPHLRPYVRVFMLVHLHFDGAGPAVVRPFPAQAEQGLIFYARGTLAVRYPGREALEARPPTLVYGQQLERLDLHLDRGETLALGITLQPSVLGRLLRVPAPELTGHNFDAEAVLGAEARCLNDRLANARSYAELVQLAEDFVWRRVQATGATLLPLDHLSRQMLAAGPPRSMADWASAACLSLRQFERRFRQLVGVSPKLLARLVHFEQAVQLHNASPGLDWLSLALRLGYHDYQHLVRDFRQFAGATPPSWEQAARTAPERLLKLV